VTERDAGVDVGVLLRRLSVELDAVSQRFADEEGLGRTDVRALTALMDATRDGRGLTAGGLGAAVDLSSASVTALVDRLERMGHVHRERDEADRRRVVVAVSESAMAAGRRFFGALQEEILDAMEGYTDEELKVVRRFLVEMTDVVSRYSRDAAPGAREAGPQR
jgi:DNA-binding MarR family transcriptional regulator